MKNDSMISNHSKGSARSFTKVLQPQLYTFFLKDTDNDEDFNEFDMDKYKSFNSERLSSRNNYFFKPKMNSKKLFEEPKFLLSLERKKIKIINGINQRTALQKPTRSSYRGLKMKTAQKILHQQKVFVKSNQKQQSKSLHHQNISQSSESRSMSKKKKQPHLHFNLHYIISKKKTFDLHTQSKQQNIQGSNLPYFNFFASDKSQIKSGRCIYTAQNFTRRSQR